MSEEVLKKLKSKRGILKAQKTNFKKKLDEFEPKISLSDVELCELEDRVQKMEETYSTFQGIQEEIEYSTDELDSELEERTSFEESYFQLVARARALINKNNAVNDDIRSIASAGHSSVSQSGGDLSGIRLPQIPLPKFSGNYGSWLEFRDLFVSLIHSSSNLVPIQKFHYLRGCLQDSAAEVIKSLDFCAANYENAWTTLCERYDNNRLLVHMHLKALFELEVIDRESADKIRCMIDNVSKGLNALKTLNQETDHWGVLIAYLVSTKLDRSTEREWEKFKGTHTTIQAWSDLKDFLKSRADFLETVERKNPTIKEKFNYQNRYGKNKQNSRSFVSNEIKCPVCQNSHNIDTCEPFLQLSVNERVEKAKALRLCLSCLRSGHFSKFCRFGGCTKSGCKGKHNVLLHIDYNARKEEFSSQAPKEPQQQRKRQ